MLGERQEEIYRGSDLKGRFWFRPKVGRPVLGFGGCLQFFKTTFFGDIEEFELEVNTLYPVREKSFQSSPLKVKCPVANSDNWLPA